MTPEVKPELCKLGKMLSNLSLSEAELLKSAVNDKEAWSAYSLAFQLKKTKHPIGATTIKIHRRKECGCYLYDAGRDTENS